MKMAIPGVQQPDLLPIGQGLRLRKYDGVYAFALPWYQDEDLLFLVDGKRTPYTLEKLGEMYTYLDRHGELYWIEILEGGAYRPIGDVTFSQEDMPIVIGEAQFRGKGIGRQVVSALVERGRALGYEKMYVAEIYSYNEGSKRCFEHAGFHVVEQTKTGARYAIELGARPFEA